jgi:acyl-CoA thioester hydrolase
MDEPGTTFTLRWADLDPNGHVRHSVYYDWGAVARIAYLEKQGVGLDWMVRNGIGPVLFREEARFSREIRRPGRAPPRAGSGGLVGDVTPLSRPA